MLETNCDGDDELKSSGASRKTSQPVWGAKTRFELAPGVRVFRTRELGTISARGRSYQLWPEQAEAAPIFEALQQGSVEAAQLLKNSAGLAGIRASQTLSSLLSDGWVRRHVGATVHPTSRNALARSTPFAGDGAVSRSAAEVQLQALLDRSFPDRFAVLALGYYLDEELPALLRESAMRDRWLIPLCHWGGQYFLGPVFGPAGFACPACLQHRLWQNHPVERWLSAEGWSSDKLWAEPNADRAVSKAMLQWAAGRLLQVAAQADANEGPSSIFALDPSDGQEYRHPVIQRPQCGQCGDSAWAQRHMNQPPVFAGALPVVSRDGGLRTSSPESTYARLRHWVDPFTGIIASIGPVPFKSNAHHTVFAASYFVSPAAGEVNPKETFQQISAGKGRTLEQARVSALCEALERHGARAQGDEPVVRGSFEELPDALDPRELMLFSDTQYRSGTPERLRQRATVRSQDVPTPFNPQQPLSWTPVWSVPCRNRRLVPTAYLLAGVERPSAERVCGWDSNGCAAGNSLEEAALQGLLELVERDAVAVWWYNRIPRPAISLRHGLSPLCKTLTSVHAELGRELWALDLTHDLGIPVVAVLAMESRTGRFAMGLGCHPSEGIAVERALLELEQVVEPRQEIEGLWSLDEVLDPSYLWPCAGGERAVRPSPFDLTTPAEELSATWSSCVRRLAQRNLQTLLFDYSRPDVALRTVKVLVPGLRHFWPRFAPGRLYQVPVTLGWRSTPLSEQQLNPLPLLM